MNMEESDFIFLHFDEFESKNDTLTKGDSRAKHASQVRKAWRWSQVCRFICML
jgi:hypothetical protein